jgi:uncharacterized protein involved in outer membrane biogenesis
MKFILKWILRLFLTAILLAIIVGVIFLFSYNAIIHKTIEQQIQSQAHMDAQIGNLKVALLSPTVRIQDLKIANAPEFGGAPFVNISEIYIDYDRAALAKKEIHIKLARINLAELDIVKNQNSQTNIFALVRAPQLRNGKTVAVSSAQKFDFKKQTGYDFQGIDALNVSVGKVKFIDLANPQNNREQIIGLDNFVIPNVKSAKDLDGLWTMIYLRSDGFFNSILGSKDNPLQDYLKSLGVTF